MARTKLALKTVRVPIKLERALEIKAKFDDLDDFLDAIKTTVYSAAGAISPTDGFAIFDSAIAGMAMTLANGTIVGETISYMFRTKMVVRHMPSNSLGASIVPSTCCVATLYPSYHVVSARSCVSHVAPLRGKPPPRSSRRAGEAPVSSSMMMTLSPAMCFGA